MNCAQLEIKANNLVVKLKKRCKKGFFDNLETRNKSKPFWSTSKPYFSNKHAKGDADILLIENNNILLDNRKVANVFNQSLKSLTYLNDQMSRNLTFLIKLTWLLTNFDLTLKLLSWSKKFSIKKTFPFKPFTKEFFKNIINGLSWNEAASGDIPPNLIKESTFCTLHIASI